MSSGESARWTNGQRGVADESAEDVEAADLFRILTNWVFSDPILRGGYPEDWVAELIAASADISEDQLAEDLTLISAPLDHYGVNYYEPTVIESPRSDKDYAGVLEVEARVLEGGGQLDNGLAQFVDLLLG